MNDIDDVDGFSDQVEALSISLSGAEAVAAAFEKQMLTMQSSVRDTEREVQRLSSGISRGLRKAFDGLIFDGDSLSDALSNLGRSMVNATYNAAITPVTDRFGSLLGAGIESVIGGLLPFGNGASFSQGRVVPFASGGVVNGPVTFPMKGGLGLMGEAGPEAIMPLTRTPDGRLGVAAEGRSQPISIVMNIQTPDAASFQRSQSQIAAQMQRALSRANRNS